MKKSIIEAVFTKNNGINFVIRTNIARGRGINGVDYLDYDGVLTNEGKTYYTTITELNEDYMVLDVQTYDKYPSYHYEEILPLENIVSIEFIKEATCWRPTTCPKNKLFVKKATRKTTKKEEK